MARRRNRLGTALVLLAVLLAGCGTSAAAEPTAPIGVAATPAVESGGPTRAEVACDDVTGSVPVTFADQARDWFTRRIEHAVTGPMGEATFYLRATTSSSYGSQDGLAVATLPAIPAPPPAPPEDHNPYKTADRRSAEQGHQADLARWQQGVDDGKVRAVAAAARLREIPLPADDRGTDITGCVIRAVDLLRPAQQRTLMVAGDLHAEGPQQSVVPDLRGVDLVVVQWCSDDAATCNARRQAFRAAVHEQAAASVTDLDPQQLQ